jgi:hypothetical protein
MIRSTGETTLTATGNAWTLCKLRQNISCSTCNVPTLNLHKRYLTCNECATLHARHPLWPRSRLSVLQPDNTTHRRLPLRVEKWTTVTSNQLVKILHFSWFLTLYMLTQHVVSVTKLSCLVILWYLQAFPPFNWSILSFKMSAGSMQFSANSVNYWSNYIYIQSNLY